MHNEVFFPPTPACIFTQGHGWGKWCQPTRRLFGVLVCCFPPVGLGQSEGSSHQGHHLEAWLLGPPVPRSPGPLVSQSLVPSLGRSASEGVLSASPARTHSMTSAVWRRVSRGVQDTPKTRARRRPPPLVPGRSHRPRRQPRAHRQPLPIGSPGPCLPPVSARA